MLARFKLWISRLVAANVDAHCIALLDRVESLEEVAEDYRTQVSDLQGQVDGNEANIEGLEATIERLDEMIADIYTGFDADEIIENALQELKNRL